MQYLFALEAFDKRFPGFEHDIHGVARDPDGNYEIECLVLEPAPVSSHGPNPVELLQPALSTHRSVATQTIQRRPSN
jgi:arginine decarboxylase